jgi:ADP-ribose pyrophosphatase YjhB (NUDIX family)
MQNYKLRVAGIIINTEKKLLLVKEKDRNIWTCPGGKLEEGETDLECLRRELFEEASLNLVEAEHFMDTDSQPLEGNATGLVAVKFYLVTSYTGDLKINENDTLEQYFWFSRLDYSYAKLEFGSALKKYAIPRLIEKGLF